MLYGIMESIVREYDSTDQAREFFKSFSGKIKSLAKDPEKSLKTSDPYVYAFNFDSCLVLFENRESQLIIHWVSGNSGKG